MRAPLICAVASILLLATSGTAAAQGAFGIGGRISFVRADVDTVDEDPSASWAARSAPGCRRGPAFELSLDMRTETNEAETLRVRRLPIQASLLLFPARGAFSPYFLGGAGWYAQRFELLAGDETVLSETMRDFGWHAGFGAELRIGRMPACTATTATPSSTSAATMTMRRRRRRRCGLVGACFPLRGSMWTAG